MGLLLLAAVTALVLTLLGLVSVALVQLVLLFSVRNTLLVIATGAVYWFLDSRRRRVARGFYSCTEVPGCSDSLALSEQPSRAMERLINRRSKPETIQRSANDAALAQMAAQEEEQKNSDLEVELATIQPGVRTQKTDSSDGASVAADATAVQFSVLSDEINGDSESRLSTVSNVSAESCSDELPVAALGTTTFTRGAPAQQTSTRLPDLRRRKWTHPSRSMPLEPKTESRVRERERKPRSGSGSASNSPRRPELYGSPRSVAVEQKLMKSALESDGYWIGDFRAPAPALPKRSQSMGVSTPTRSSSSAATNTNTSANANATSRHWRAA